MQLYLEALFDWAYSLPCQQEHTRLQKPQKPHPLLQQLVCTRKVSVMPYKFGLLFAVAVACMLPMEPPWLACGTRQKLLAWRVESLCCNNVVMRWWCVLIGWLLSVLFLFKFFCFLACTRQPCMSWYCFGGWFWYSAGRKTTCVLVCDQSMAVCSLASFDMFVSCVFFVCVRIHLLHWSSTLDDWPECVLVNIGSQLHGCMVAWLMVLVPGSFAYFLQTNHWLRQWHSGPSLPRTP